jgi:hypothetical protein
MFMRVCLCTKFHASSFNNLLVNAKQKAKYKFRAAAMLLDFLQKITWRNFYIFQTLPPQKKFKNSHKCHTHLKRSHDCHVSIAYDRKLEKKKVVSYSYLTL